MKKILLIDRLQNIFKDASKRTLLQWIKFGRIYANNKCIKKPHVFIFENDKIILKNKENILKNRIKIIFQDDYFLVIEKPENLLSVPLDNKPSENLLKILRKHFNTKDIFALHRIDYETSGLLIYPKTWKSLNKFKDLLKEKKINREYLAIVDQNYNLEDEIFIDYLEEKNNLKVYTTPNKEKGKIAIGHFKTLFKTKKYTFLNVTLKTGRKHQIRVQLASRGFPIIGDKKYSNTKDSYKRLCLHAYKLSFIHPFTNKKMIFNSPPPHDIKKLSSNKIGEFNGN